MFWRLDRFSREGALATLRYLKDHGVNYKSFTEPYLDSLGLFDDVIVSMLATSCRPQALAGLFMLKGLRPRKV